MEAAVTSQLGQHLRDRRVELGWSIRDLEQRSGVHNSQITRIETGQIKDPAIHKVQRLCTAMDLSATQLLINDGQLERPSHGHLIELIAPYLPEDLLDQVRTHYQQTVEAASSGGAT
jgi:transcriptional regulator with XRE-family HTH domain